MHKSTIVENIPQGAKKGRAIDDHYRRRCHRRHHDNVSVEAPSRTVVSVESRRTNPTPLEQNSRRKKILASRHGPGEDAWAMSRSLAAPLFALPLAFVALFASPTAEAFCGFYVAGADQKLFNNATNVVLMRQGTRTVLSMQNNYQGPPENFAMVVPVHVVLQKENVQTLPNATFDKVDKLAAPRLVEYWEEDPCSPDRRFELQAAAAPAGGNAW